MSFLSKDEYERRALNAGRRMEEQREITTLTEEQHDKLAALCGLRHDAHCAKGLVLYYAEYAEHDTYRELFTNLTGLEHNFAEMIKEIDPEYDTTELEEIITQITNLETDAELLDVCPDATDEEILKHAEENIFAYDDLMEDVNREVERFLSYIDVKHGTRYCPTGAYRV